MPSSVRRRILVIVLPLFLFFLTLPVGAQAAHAPSWSGSFAEMVQGWVPWIELPWSETPQEDLEDGEAGPHVDPHGNNLAGSDNDVTDSDEDQAAGEAGPHVDPHG